MRGFCLKWMVAAAIVLSPLTVLAGNQEVAEQIAASLKSSGQFRGCKIGIRYYQDGTASLRGTVSNSQQIEAAEQIARQVPGVTNVVNELTLAAAASQQAVQQPAGAFAPERLASGDGFAVGSSQATGSRLVSRLPVTQTADPVPAEFAAAPVQRTSALAEGPALTPPEVTPTGANELVGVPTPAQPATPTPAPAAPKPLRPIPIAMAQGAADQQAAPMEVQSVPMNRPLPMYAGAAGGAAPVRYDQPSMPNYAWPSYAAYPNYAALTYPKQYSATAWPYIGPFYPYPQVPLGWRKVTLEWHDGWWFLDFDDGSHKGPVSGLFRAIKGH